MDEHYFTDVNNETSNTETPSAELASDGSLNEADASISDQSVHVSAFQEEESDQPSPRGLIDQHQHSELQTVEERYEDLEIEVIQHFILIPDYKTPTDSKHPIVAKTPHGYFCLDGWNLVEAAKANGKGSITCVIEYLADHSDEELSLRKGALRFKPRGGVSSYAEKVRIVASLKQMLLASTNDLRAFHHGGTRKGEEFSNNQQENVTRVLAYRLGKSVSTINQYLSHARFISDETLNSFAASEVKKDFFEKANRNKTTVLTRMKSDRKSDSEITEQISTCMLGWLQEYDHHGEIRPIWENTETDTQEAIGTPQEELLESTPKEIKKEEIFSPWCSSATEDEIDSIDKIKRDAGDLAKRLLDAVVLEDPNLFYDRIMEETPRFYKISFRASALRKMQG